MTLFHFVLLEYPILLVITEFLNMLLLKDPYSETYIQIGIGLDYITGTNICNLYTYIKLKKNNIN